MRKIARDRILNRDNHKCNKCGSIEHLEIDHVIPLSKGGTHSESNFQVLCRKCNREKSNTLDIDKFFKKGDGEKYILMSRDFAKIMPNLTSKELDSVFEQMFEKYCQEV